MKYLIILIAILISFSVLGQDYFLEKKGDIYFYKGQLYSFDELAILYEDHPASMDLYLSGKRSKIGAKIFAILGIPFLVGGGLGLASGGFNPKILGPLLILTGGAIELIALIPKGVANRRFRKARRLFNYEMIERHGYQSDTSLSLAATGNGVGFVLQF